MACPTCGQEHRRCTAHKRFEAPGVELPGGPRPCSKWPMRGQTVCASHGGKAKQNKAAGQRRETERKAAAMAHRWGMLVETTPTDAILGQVKVWAGLELHYRELVEALPDEQRIWGLTKKTKQGVAVAGVGIQQAAGKTFEAKPHVLVELHERASANLVKCSVEAIRAGIEERKVRLAEQQGAQVAEVIKSVFGDLQAALAAAGAAGELLERLQQAFTESAPKHLRLLTG